jgi:hypothetical protein
LAGTSEHGERVEAIDDRNCAEELQQRLSAAARTGEAVLGMRNTYGQRYIVDFEMTTTVGTAVVRSTWIMLTGEDVPRLTSCYVL